MNNLHKKEIFITDSRRGNGHKIVLREFIA